MTYGRTTRYTNQALGNAVGIDKVSWPRTADEMADRVGVAPSAMWRLNGAFPISPDAGDQSLAVTVGTFATGQQTPYASELCTTHTTTSTQAATTSSSTLLDNPGSSLNIAWAMRGYFPEPPAVDNRWMISRFDGSVPQYGYVLKRYGTTFNFGITDTTNSISDSVSVTAPSETWGTLLCGYSIDELFIYVVFVDDDGKIYAGSKALSSSWTGKNMRSGGYFKTTLQSPSYLYSIVGLAGFIHAIGTEEDAVKFATGI